jgi:atypical protein kinase C zeta type
VSVAHIIRIRTVFILAVILEKNIRIPRSLSVKASNVLKGFLNKDPKNRLGCVPDLTQALNDIKTHGFFNTMEWDLVGLIG